MSGQSHETAGDARAPGARAGGDGQTHEVAFAEEDCARGESLAALLSERGLALNMRCGGRGLCNGCLVFLGDDAEPARACMVSLANGARGISRVTVPARSLLRLQPSIVDDFRLKIPAGRDPIAPDARHGVAVDAGTTTVAALVCDLGNGRVLARASAFNGQIRFGEDVLTRIQRCIDGGAAAVRELQDAVARETIQPLIEKACAETGLTAEDAGVVVIAGNTTMLHLIAGVDPGTLGVHPFTPGFLEHRSFAAGKIGLRVGKNAGARAHLLPGLSAYVGADLTAGLIATGMIYEEGPALLVDAGTNGEIVAKMGGRIVGCATAAGPAFEGAGLSCGMRAVEGAIERVRMRVDEAGVFTAELDVIGAGGGAAKKPLGMCGSALIDFLWEARRAGLLRENGRFEDQEKLPKGAHVEAETHGRRFLICEDGASGALWISERDIVRLLQAKAAIGAGICTLLEVLGITARDIKRLYLAGGFGMHLSLEHAIGCGLLPGFSPGQVEIVGNTSLGGAYLAMNDKSLLDEMEGARRRFQAVELNLQPGFEDMYVDNLLLK